VLNARWGRRSLNVTPAGKVLPCHAAAMRKLPAPRARIASMIGSSTNLCTGATGRVQIQKNDKSRQIASTTLRHDLVQNTHEPHRFWTHFRYREAKNELNSEFPYLCIGIERK
jgi:hypothetical protein